MELLAAMIMMPFLMFGALMMTFVIDLVLAFPLMWAWNYALPELFKLPQVNYWQAFCLLIVASLLIKGSPSSSSK